MENQSVLELVKLAMKKAKGRRMYERYQAIYLHLQDNNPEEIARTLNRNVKTIHSYIKAYETGGLPGLQMNHSPGAPVRLSKEQQEQLKQVIVQSIPHEVGFPAKHNWTLQMIANYIQREFGLTYSLRGVSKMMHRQGLSYTRPTYTLAAADEEKQRHFADHTFPGLKKTPK